MKMTQAATRTWVRQVSRAVSPAYQLQQQRGFLGLSSAIDTRAYRMAKSVMPTISATEQTALGWYVFTLWRLLARLSKNNIRAKDAVVDGDELRKSFLNFVCDSKISSFCLFILPFFTSIMMMMLLFSGYTAEPLALTAISLLEIHP